MCCNQALKSDHIRTHRLKWLFKDSRFQIRIQSREYDLHRAVSHKREVILPLLLSMFDRGLDQYCHRRLNALNSLDEQLTLLLILSSLQECYLKVCTKVQTPQHL